MSMAALNSVIDGLDDDIDMCELRRAIDRLEKKFSELIHGAKQRADHAGHGFCSVTSWIATTCGMTPTSVGDRLCVGEQLEAMPQIAEALESGRISYQASAVICHLRKGLGEKSGFINEEEWIRQAQGRSIKDLNFLADHARYVWDPDSFDRWIEEDYEQRFLSISESRGLYHLSAVLDREGDGALKTALDALTKRLGPDDLRTNKQRRADALVEIVHHAMDKGTLPRRNGVRPHINVNTTPDGLKGEVGAPASELEAGMPISSKTVRRLACDGTLSRVMKADSMVIDVGRATRSISGPQRRGLKTRFKTCGGVGCDRPLSMTSAHHIEFWGKGGQTNMSELLPLCYYHHRLVHEGGWQVVRAGDGVKFIPPERLLARLARSPGWPEAA